MATRGDDWTYCCSALIHAATMVKAGVFLVARIGPLFFALGAAGILADQFFEVIAWTGAITALLLATQGMVNKEIKKVLAYSTGSQIGYMMMALGIAGLSHQFVDGFTAGFYHLISHAIFKASLFMAAGSLIHVVGSRFMSDMGGLRKHMKKTYAFMWAAGLGLMGAPFITTGFWSKDAVFAAVFDSGSEWALPIFRAIAVLTAVITAFYTHLLLWLARAVFRYFEKTAIDYGMNMGMQKAVGWSAKMVQGTQTGVAQSYLFVFGAGILFLALILLI